VKQLSVPTPTIAPPAPHHFMDALTELAARRVDAVIDGLAREWAAQDAAADD